MAKFDTKGLDEVAAYMLKQDEATLKIVPEMLKAGGAVIQEAQKKQINALLTPQGLQAHSETLSRYQM